MVERTEEVLFSNPDTLQFRCQNCNALVTWSVRRSWLKGGHQCDCLIDRRDCQGRMIAARCPGCKQLYAQRFRKSRMVPNEQLER